MHARIYDFTLTAGGMQRLPVVGDFFKVISATGTINVNVDTGATLDLLPGQGLREFDFNALTISDKSGAANVGKILVGFSGMIDDRVTGEVSVIDGGKSRSIAGQAFQYGLGVSAGVGLYAIAQIQNPAGSGKNVIVKAYKIAAQTAGVVAVAMNDAPLQADVSGTASKLIGSANNPALKFYAGAIAGAAGPGYYDIANLQANSEISKVLQEPWVLVPGVTMKIHSATAQQTLNCVFEWNEEPV